MNEPTRGPIFACLYQGLCDVARKHGYALAIHGTLVNDMDLIAVPWVEAPSTPAELKDALMQHIGAVGYGDFLRRDNPWLTEEHITEVMKMEACVDPDGAHLKPHGRIAWNLYLEAGTKIDLSILQTLQPPPADSWYIDKATAERAIDALAYRTGAIKEDPRAKGDGTIAQLLREGCEADEKALIRLRADLQTLQTPISTEDASLPPDVVESIKQAAAGHIAEQVDAEALRSAIAARDHNRVCIDRLRVERDAWMTEAKDWRDVAKARKERLKALDAAITELREEVVKAREVISTEASGMPGTMRAAMRLAHDALKQRHDFRLDLIKQAEADAMLPSGDLAKTLRASLKEEKAALDYLATALGDSVSPVQQKVFDRIQRRSLVRTIRDIFTGKKTEP